MCNFHNLAVDATLISSPSCLCIYQQFEHDTVLIPIETAWFGYYPEGAFDPVLPPQQVYSLLQILGKRKQRWRGS